MARRSRSFFGKLSSLAFAVTAVALAGALPPGSTSPEPSKETPAAIRAELDELARRKSLPESFDQPDQAAEDFVRQRLGESSDIDPVDKLFAARERLARMPRYSLRLGTELPSEREIERDPSLAEKAELGTWESLGPGNVGGRTRALVIHPTSPAIKYAAGVSGGVWKTTGGDWQPVLDLQPNIAVSSLAMDPADPDILYAGTGEGYFREVIRGTDLPLRGAGIFKTTDAGATWTRLESTTTNDFHWVNDIVISPNRSRFVYAATRTGIWRSKHRGSTWKRVLDPQVNGGCLDLVIRTDRDTDQLLAACGTFEQSSIWRTVRGERGKQWTRVLTEEGMGRTTLALAPSNQDVVYALATSIADGPGGRFDGGLHAVFRSDRGGEEGSWTATVRNTDPVHLNTQLLSNPVISQLVACGFDNEDGNSTLGWHANAIAVDPLDPEIVWAGGVDLFRSDDGGHNWGLASYWWQSPPSAHADHHVIVFHPRYDGDGQQKMFVGNDGGVWRTRTARAPVALGDLAACDPANTGVRWVSFNRNYGVTQFYQGTPFPDGRGYIGGAQDNGTLLSSDTLGSDGWLHILGGDGGYTAVDPTDPNVLYAESQGLALAKSVNGGASFEDAVTGITEPRANFLFIVPLAMDPSEPRRLWIGGRTLWRSDDGAATWVQASQQLSASAKISAIAVAPSDPDRVVVGMNDGSVFFTDRGTTADASTVWEASRPRDGGWVAWLTFRPTEADVVYATYTTFGGDHVFKSVDGGVSWHSIDGKSRRGLPDIPVHSILVDPTDHRRLFLGTDLGVLVSTRDGRRWAVENTGFANAVTESLSWVEEGDGTGVLFAFTHGRGAWRVEVAP